MSTSREHEREERRLKCLELYAPRLPMVRLPDQYRVTAANPGPPLVHFAIGIDAAVLYKYAEEHYLTEYLPRFPNIVSPVTLLVAAEHLSKGVQYELEFGWPFKATADCSILLGLYSNYTMEDKRLIDEDQEDVIQLVQEDLGLDKSVRPKWYFDIHDLWQPDYY